MQQALNSVFETKWLSNSLHAACSASVTVKGMSVRECTLHACLARTHACMYSQTHTWNGSALRFIPLSTSAYCPWNTLQALNGRTGCMVSPLSVPKHDINRSRSIMVRLPRPGEDVDDKYSNCVPAECTRLLVLCVGTGESIVDVGAGPNVAQQLRVRFLPVRVPARYEVAQRSNESWQRISLLNPYLLYYFLKEVNLRKTIL